MLPISESHSHRQVHTDSLLSSYVQCQPHVSITPSLGIQETEVAGSDPHFVLFDTGPDSRSIIRNINALKIPVERIERVVLSHWHSDHSGGMLAFLRHRQALAPAAQTSTACVVDVHPDRPIARGIAPVSQRGRVIGRLPADPTFAQIEECGGVVETHAQGHVVAGGTVWVSGDIPRVTHFEGGLPSGVRWREHESGESPGWVKEEVCVAACLSPGIADNCIPGHYG